jgi:hypothetical protein
MAAAGNGGEIFAAAWKSPGYRVPAAWVMRANSITPPAPVLALNLQWH